MWEMSFFSAVNGSKMQFLPRLLQLQYSLNDLTELL